ncbi:MAG: alpha-amylase family glycosyl hydrolase [Rhodanobacter sp.]
MIRPVPVASIILSAALLLSLAMTPASFARATPANAAVTNPSHRPAPSGVWYEIFVRSFDDSNGDGIGDLNGVTAKLDYLKSLGISGIWLMPINPSPSYHGYDVTDYEAINPQYGSMADFQRLLAAAHRRGIKVIIDLVINHTSNRHPWFLAAQNPDDPHHDWYSWATPGTDLAARSAAGDRAWQALPDGRHYLGIFSAGMPDLNYDTPAVREAMVKVGQFWMRKGVDGFRLDAARHIYLNFASQEGDPEVLRENLAWWQQFMRGVRQVNPHAYVVGEVTEKTPAQLAPWFGTLSAVFDFPLATHLIEAANSEKADDLAERLERTDAAFRASAGRHGVDATFLSNHDQNRVMSQLGGNPQHMRMAAAMLLTLPGRPFVYYGEELGMRGVKPDPDLREPMRWQRATDAPGETRWKTSTAKQGGDVSVAAEQTDPDSLLHYYTMLIHWRAQVSALRDGRIRDVPMASEHLLAYELEDAGSRVLVIHNLSRTAQTIPLGDTHGHRFDALLLQSRPGVTLDHDHLRMPAYTTAILR